MVSPKNLSKGEEALQSISNLRKEINFSFEIIIIKFHINIVHK